MDLNANQEVLIRSKQLQQLELQIYGNQQGNQIIRIVPCSTNSTKTILLLSCTFTMI